MYARKPVLLAYLFITIFQTDSFSQGRWKAGIGGNYISNNMDVQYLDSYLAPSFNLGYTFLRKSSFSLEVEWGNTVKSRQEQYSSQTGFTSSLPLLANLDTRKMNFHAGGGPAFLLQQSTTYGERESLSGGYLHYTAGVGFKGKPFLANVLYPQYTLRVSYFSSVKRHEFDAGMLSLIVFFRG